MTVNPNTLKATGAFIMAMRREWMKMNPHTSPDQCPVLNPEQYPLPQMMALTRGIEAALTVGCKPGR